MDDKEKEKLANNIIGLMGKDGSKLGEKARQTVLDALLRKEFDRNKDPKIEKEHRRVTAMAMKDISSLMKPVIETLVEEYYIGDDKEVRLPPTLLTAYVAEFCVDHVHLNHTAKVANSMTMSMLLCSDTDIGLLTSRLLAYCLERNVKIKGPSGEHITGHAITDEEEKAILSGDTSSLSDLCDEHKQKVIDMLLKRDKEDDAEAISQAIKEDVASMVEGMGGEIEDDFFEKQAEVNSAFIREALAGRRREKLIDTLTTNLCSNPTDVAEALGKDYSDSEDSLNEELQHIGLTARAMAEKMVEGIEGWESKQ